MSNSSAWSGATGKSGISIVEFEYRDLYAKYEQIRARIYKQFDIISVNDYKRKKNNLLVN